MEVLVGRPVEQGIQRLQPARWPPPRGRWLSTSCRHSTSARSRSSCGRSSLTRSVQRRAGNVGLPRFSTLKVPMRKTVGRVVVRHARAPPSVAPGETTAEESRSRPAYPTRRRQ